MVSKEWRANWQREYRRKYPERCKAYQDKYKATHPGRNRAVYESRTIAKGYTTVTMPVKDGWHRVYEYRILVKDQMPVRICVDGADEVDLVAVKKTRPSQYCREYKKVDGVNFNQLKAGIYNGTFDLREAF